MTALWKLELVKLARPSTLLYLLAPNLGSLGYTLALLAAVVTGRNGYAEGLGALLSAFVWLHPLVAGAYAQGALMLCADLWSSEASDRTLRTLVLMQVPRRQLLVVRTALVAGVMTASAALYFALFLVSAVVVRATVSARAWDILHIPIHDAAVGLVPYVAVLALGLVTLVLWVTLVSLACARASTATMLSMVSLLVVAASAPEGWAEYLFPHALWQLAGHEVLKPLVLGIGEGSGLLSALAAVLAGNALVLAVGCSLALARKEFQ